MALVLGKNSYTTVDEADAYFEDRLDVSDWESASESLKEKAIVTASRWIDSFAFKGYATSDSQFLAWPRKGYFEDKERGRSVAFDEDYSFTELKTTDTETFLEAFTALPREFQLLKKAAWEQAYHLLNNESTLDTTSGSPSNIQVGNIVLQGLNEQGAPVRSKVTSTYLRPLLDDAATAPTWYRSN